MMYYARSTPADLLLSEKSGKLIKDFRNDARYFELVASENSQANLRNAWKTSNGYDRRLKKNSESLRQLDFYNRDFWTYNGLQEDHCCTQVPSGKRLHVHRQYCRYLSDFKYFEFTEKLWWIQFKNKHSLLLIFKILPVKIANAICS